MPRTLSAEPRCLSDPEVKTPLPPLPYVKPPITSVASLFNNVKPPFPSVASLFKT